MRDISGLNMDNDKRRADLEKARAVQRGGDRIIREVRASADPALYVASEIEKDTLSVRSLRLGRLLQAIPSVGARECDVLLRLSHIYGKAPERRQVRSLLPVQKANLINELLDIAS